MSKIDYLQVAADMLCNDTGDKGLLHYDFSDYLDQINGLVCEFGGHLNSRQVIAMAIASWWKLNPNEKIYGE